MIVITVAFAAMQVGAWVVTPTSPTVGDTVVLSREVVIDVTGVLVRPGALESSPQIEPLQIPRVEYGSGGARVFYVVALFESEPPIAMPPTELVFPDGRIEVLPGGEVVVGLRSVLPEEDSLPPARSSQGPVARLTTRRDLLIVPPTALLILTVVWAVIGRRPRTRPVWQEDQVKATIPSLTRWISAGEPRAVAAVVGSQLRDHLAALVPEARRGLALDECLQVLVRHRPEWPLRELSEVAHALERASFAPAVPHDVLALADDADELLRSINRQSETPAEPESPEESEPGDEAV